MTLGKLSKLGMPPYAYLVTGDKYPPQGLNEIMYALKHKTKGCLQALTLSEMETGHWFQRST